MGPGSYSPATNDIHQEGIFIPPVKLFEAGEPNASVLEMIMSNIRNRSIGFGDLRSQYASCETAERRLSALIERYGFDNLTAGMAEIVARSEQMTRARITEFPDGDYHARDCLDGDGRLGDKVWVDVKVTIRGSDIVVDLSGSSDQSTGGMNCSYSAAASAVQYAIKSITDPENPPNAGSYKPITVKTRPGSLVDAQKPGSMIGFGDVCYRVLDATMTAIAGAIGDRAIASGSGSTGTAVIAGRQQRANGDHYFTTIELSSGAYGARATCDGMNAIRYGPGNAGHIPIEADEIENPLFFEAYEIVPDTGGAGRFRGGNGFVRAFRVQADRAQICLCADRHNTPPPGLFGGEPGATSRYVLSSGTNREEVLPSKTPYIDLESGTLVRVQSAGGGGYGDPRERDPAAIADDFKNGYITEEGAKGNYGYSPKIER
jgi:N-methylhydantoinase B